MASQPQTQKIYWFLILVFILFSMTVGTVGYFFYEQQKRIFKKEKWDQISAIGDMKVHQIFEWRKERLGDAAIIKGRLMAHHIADVLQNPEAKDLRRKLLDFMAILQSHYQYHSIVLLDEKGKVRLALPEHEGTLGLTSRRLVLECLQKREVILSDLYRSELTHRIRLNLFVPITIKKNGRMMPIGIMVLRTDVYQVLFPVIQSWPTRSPSSECILVRREGNDVVVLNELIHKKDTTLNLRLPMKEKGMPSVMAVLEKAGIVEGKDYRGMPVLAALRKIPDSPWFLVAKVDQEEIYAPIRMRSRLIASLVGVLIFGAGLSVILLWRGQRFQFERKQYEAELERRKLSDRLDYLTRYANDIILLMDEDLNIVEANERAVEQYGYTREKLLQLKMKELRAPETRPYLDAQLKKVKEQNGAVIETIHQKKDGTKISVENSVRLIEVGEKRFYQSIIRDITERKRAEETLKKSEGTARQLAQENEIMAEIGRIVSSTLNIEEVYQHFVDKVNQLIPFDRISIVTINHQNNTLTINCVSGKELAGYEQGMVLPLAGSPSEELMRTRSSLFIQTEDEKELAERMPYLVSAFKAGFRSMISVPLISREQVIGGFHLRSIKPNAYTERDLKLAERVANQIAGAIANAQLFTERQRIEKEKSLVEEQFRQSQKMEAIGRLAGGIAHDFNNLLTVIKGTCQLSLLDLREGDPLKANLKEIETSAERAADLTRQLLAFSRKQILEVQVLDLNTIIKNLDKILYRILGEDIELVTFFTEGIGRIKADRGQIEQVIINLAVNSRDAMPQGGKLTIETANVELDEEYAHRHIGVKPGPHVMLSFSDTGVGMTQEVKERIFEPFFTTKEMGKGTGLGLSTVYGIVKQSGGNIWVYSELDKGTIFKIYLPGVDEPIEEAKKIVEKGELPRGDETILVVEDEEDVRKLTVRILEKQGYKVLEASQGLDAFLTCEKQEGPIHLLLTDVVMPKMSGRELAGRIASIHPEIKVLYMSGYTDNVIAHHGILEKGVEYMQKPFTLENLARKVREALDK